MIEGRHVLEVALVWAVGNEHNIRIWKDPWIVGGANVRVTTGTP